LPTLDTHIFTHSAPYPDTIKLHIHTFSILYTIPYCLCTTRYCILGIHEACHSSLRDFGWAPCIPLCRGNLHVVRGGGMIIGSRPPPPQWMQRARVSFYFLTLHLIYHIKMKSSYLSSYLDIYATVLFICCIQYVYCNNNVIQYIMFQNLAPGGW
jgi:hypothetical protein